jgi:protein tyrosine phosphatase
MPKGWVCAAQERTNALNNARSHEFGVLAEKPGANPTGDSDEAGIAARCAGKSRYSNVGAVPDTRVEVSMRRRTRVSCILSSSDDEYDSGTERTYDDEEDVLEYVNANVHTDRSSNARYLLSNAPTHRGMEGFMWTLWRYNISVVVMLTKIVEGGRRKADEYLPSEIDASLTYGWMEVVLKEKMELCGGAIVVRTFTLQNTGDGSEPLTIRHVWYTEWPDFGVPTSTEKFLETMKLADVFGDNVLVHCSAGIGRAGTYVAASLARARLLRGEIVDIPAIVEEIRKSRNGAVQRVEQYQFLYEMVDDMRRVLAPHAKPADSDSRGCLSFSAGGQARPSRMSGGEASMVRDLSNSAGEH